MKKEHISTPEPVSRRAFLKSTSSIVVAGAALHALSIDGPADPREGSVAGAAQYYSASQTSASGSDTKLASQRLLTGWEYRRGNLGGVWEVWRKANETQKWEKPAKLILEEIGRSGETVSVQVRAQDRNGVPCLDARNVVRFGLTGDGRLVDNLGTSTTARKLELYNGRALISLQRKGEIVVSVTSDGLPTAFLRISEPGAVATGSFPWVQGAE